VGSQWDAPKQPEILNIERSLIPFWLRKTLLPRKLPSSLEMCWEYLEKVYAKASDLCTT
jgi:hypothetical protein